MGLSSKQVANDRNGWNQALLQAAGTLELPRPTSMKKQPSQQQQQQGDPLKCPRCDSTNTKFCYYNNYNKSQPRHFCKACKRHWTKGGTLRNVPVGGGRKNKRLKTSSVPKTSSKTTSTTAAKNFNNSMSVQVQPRVVLPFGGLGHVVDDHKNFSEAYENFLKQAHDTSITFNSKCMSNIEGNNYGISYLGSTLSLSPCNGQFHHQQYSNLASFENNPGEISSTITSIPSPSMYNSYTGEHHHQNQANGLEENVMNNNNNTSMSSSSLSDHHQQPWATCTTTEAAYNNNVMDLSSNWGWEDFDKFVSVDADLTMPWDDTDIKP